MKTLSTDTYTEYGDGFVIHVAVMVYHPPCDKTYHGYTAHRCEALRSVERVGKLGGVPQWIKTGDHTQ